MVEGCGKPIKYVQVPPDNRDVMRLRRGEEVKVGTSVMVVESALYAADRVTVYRARVTDEMVRKIRSAAKSLGKRPSRITSRFGRFRKPAKKAAALLGALALLGMCRHSYTTIHSPLNLPTFAISDIMGLFGRTESARRWLGEKQTCRQVSSSIAQEKNLVPTPSSQPPSNMECAQRKVTGLLRR